MDAAHQGLIAGLAVAAFSAATSVLVRWIGARIPPITLNAWRCTVAALIFLPLWWTIGGAVPDVRTLAWIGLSVLFSIVLGDTSFFLAIKKIGVSKATPVAKIFPAIAVLLSCALLGETLSALKLLGVGLAVSGTILISRATPAPVPVLAEADERMRASARDHRIGLAIAVGTAFAWALGAMVLKISLTTADVVTISLFKTVISGGILWSLSAGVDRVPVRAVLFDRTSLLLAMATGVTLAGAALLLVFSISKVGAGPASVYAGLAPLFAVPAGVLIFKEQMGVSAVIGCLVAVVGVICVSIG